MLREVDWLGIAPWLILFRAPGVALGSYAFLFALAGMLLVGGLAGGPPPLLGECLPLREGPVQSESIPSLGGAASFLLGQGDGRSGQLFLGLWRAVVWSFCGLGIALSAARGLTYAQEQSLHDTLRRAAGRWPRALGAIAVVAVVVAVPAFFLWIAGLLLHAPVVGWAAALLWPLAIALGLAVAVLGLGAAVGWPLLLAAVAVEGVDALDAVSRMYAYVTQRLFRLVFYLLVAAAIGACVAFFVELVAGETIHALRYLAGAAPETRYGAIVRAWEAAFLGAARAIYPAYFFTAATAVYLLLRHDVDGQAVDEMDAGE